jgi:hypothetical protein
MRTPKSKPKIMNTESQSIDDADPMSSLRIKLKAADPEIQNYVTALETENLKCARKVAKLQAENVTLNNRIKSLIEQNEKDEGKTLAEIMSRAGEQLRKAKQNKSSENDKS